MEYDNSSFYYCPKCIIDNNNLLIIKREHQISGVCVCPLHECFFEKYIIRNRRDRINFTEFNFDKIVQYNNNKMLASISKNVLYIFKENLSIEFPELVLYLKTRLIKEGIIGKDGRVNISKEIHFKKSFQDDPEIYRNIMRSCSLEQLFSLSRYSLIKPLVFIIIINKLYDDFESFYKEACSIRRNDN